MAVNWNSRPSQKKKWQEKAEADEPYGSDTDDTEDNNDIFLHHLRAAGSQRRRQSRLLGQAVRTALPSDENHSARRPKRLFYEGQNPAGRLMVAAKPLELKGAMGGSHSPGGKHRVSKKRCPPKAKGKKAKVDDSPKQEAVAAAANPHSNDESSSSSASVTAFPERLKDLLAGTSHIFIFTTHHGIVASKIISQSLSLSHTVFLHHHIKNKLDDENDPKWEQREVQMLGRNISNRGFQTTLRAKPANYHERRDIRSPPSRIRRPEREDEHQQRIPFRLSAQPDHTKFTLEELKHKLSPRLHEVMIHGFDDPTGIHTFAAQCSKAYQWMNAAEKSRQISERYAKKPARTNASWRGGGEDSGTSTVAPGVAVTGTEVAVRPFRAVYTVASNNTRLTNRAGSAPFMDRKPMLQLQGGRNPSALHQPHKANVLERGGGSDGWGSSTSGGDR
ncbi:hypothetical protein MMC07_006654 [Pseudocyphellaria aurata]|nr:hypothetical protein [Pseudocyphellaria aurata]